MRHQGVTLIVFKADLFQPFEEFASRADEFAASDEGDTSGHRIRRSTGPR